MTTTTAAAPLSAAYQLGVKPGKGEKLPPPACRLTDNPALWLRNKAQALLISVPAGHVLLFVWVAVYFALFQTNLLTPLVQLFGTHMSTRDWWNTLFSQHVPIMSQSSWDTWRHMFRDGGETYMVGMLVGFLTANPFAHSFKPLTSGWQIAGRVAVSVLAVIPLFVVFGLALHLLQSALHASFLSNSIGAHPSLAAKLYGSAYATKAAIFAAGFVGRRPMIPVFVYVMEYFAERRVASGRGERFWQTAPFKALLRIQSAAGQHVAVARQQERSVLSVWAFSCSGVAILALAVWGVIILNNA